MILLGHSELYMIYLYYLLCLDLILYLMSFIIFVEMLITFLIERNPSTSMII